MNQFKLLKRLVVIYFKKALQQEIAFRFDFFVKILFTLLELAGSVGGILIIFSKVETINGWHFHETLVVTGMFLLIQNLKNLFIGPSLNGISGLDGELWTGRFDFTLLKPVPTQFYISIQKWSPLVIIDLVISMAVIAYALIQISTTVTIINIVAFIISIFISLTLLYSIMLALTSAAFWYLGTPLLWIFDSVIQMGRYPVKIYPTTFKFILTWVIPVGFMITIPAESLIGKVNLFEISGGILLAVFCYLISLMFFRRSIQKYSSASS